MRSSKSKAMDQVKQWCGSMKDEDNERMYLNYSRPWQTFNFAYVILIDVCNIKRVLNNI